MRGLYFQYAAADTVTRFLPKSAATRLARLLAGVYAVFSPDREAIIGNLREVCEGMPGFSAGPAQTQAQLEKMSRHLILNFTTQLSDLFYVRDLSASYVRERVEWRGLKNLDAALSMRRGAIVVSGHIGHWEMGAMALGLLGYPLHVIVARHRDERIDRLFQERRRHCGLRVIPLGGHSRDFYRVLARNQVLALNGDRLFEGEGRPVRFFKRRVLFPRGLARLSLSTGAPVIPTFCTALGHDCYRVELLDPIAGGDEGALLQGFADVLEGMVRRYPTQWYLFQPYWQKSQWPT